MPLPSAINTAILEARQTLLQSLSVSTASAKSHQIAIVEGWARDPVVIRAVAIYMVGLVASAIHRNLEVAAALGHRADDRVEIVLNVEKLVGTAGSPLSDSQKEDERNPWLAEGLWHLCLWLAASRPDLHPPGLVIALDRNHISAKDHGTDVVGIYVVDPNTFGVSFVECKAYRNDPSAAVVAAGDFFRKVDSGAFDQRIRQVVADLRLSLPGEYQAIISPSLWKDVRSYIPNPHYDASNLVDWNITRPKLAGLAVPCASVVIMPNAIDGFAKFFDEISEAMLDFVVTLPQP